MRKKQRSPDERERRQRILFYALGGSGFVALAAALIVVFALGSGGGGSGGLTGEFRAAGCRLFTTPGLPAKSDHSNVTLKTKVKYGSYPPANGPHYGAPARWDFYTEPVPPVQAVHNEEHGGVIVWYGQDVSDQVVQALRDFYSEDPVSMLVTPLARFDGKVAITAWTGDPSRYFKKGYFGEGHVAICTQFGNKTIDAFRSFRNEYRGKGPEGTPASANQPGS